MTFENIFLTLFVFGWLLCGAVPWLVSSVLSRGTTGLAYLPLSMFAALVAGLAVPALGKSDGTGLLMSVVAALVVPSLLLGARRFSLGAAPRGQSLATEPREHIE